MGRTGIRPRCSTSLRVADLLIGPPGVIPGEYDSRLHRPQHPAHRVAQPGADFAEILRISQALPEHMSLARRTRQADHLEIERVKPSCRPDRRLLSRLRLGGRRRRQRNRLLCLLTPCVSRAVSSREFRPAIHARARPGKERPSRQEPLRDLTPQRHRIHIRAVGEHHHGQPLFRIPAEPPATRLRTALPRRCAVTDGGSSPDPPSRAGRPGCCPAFARSAVCPARPAASPPWR